MNEILLATGAIIGGIIGWALKTWRARLEIRQLKTKIKHLAAQVSTELGKNLQNNQKAREILEDACVEFTRTIDVLMSCKADSGWNDNAKAARNDCCRVLHRNVIPSFRSWYEWIELAYPEDHETFAKIVSREVIPELRRFKKWMDVLNHRRLLDALSESPAEISNMTVAPFTYCLTARKHRVIEAAAPHMMKAIEDLCPPTRERS